MGHCFLVRHATTDASASGRNLGQATDAPLTGDGQRLAERLGAAIRGEVAALEHRELRLVSSPARRCQDTAAAIARALAQSGKGTEVQLEPGIRELDYGAWEGLTAEECRRQDPGRRTRWEADPYRVTTPGGESGADVAARAFPALDALDQWLARRADRVAVVVSHNHVIRLRLAARLGIPLRDYRRRLWVDPASYSLLEIGPSQDSAVGEATVHRLGVLPLSVEP